MPTNALLVRWSGGWHEVADADSMTAYGRREALLGLGAVQSLGELERVADQQLAIYASPRSQITADLVPVDDDDTPYLSFRVGDTITVPDETGAPTSERVMGLTVSEDEDGLVSFVPQLKDTILAEQERFEQAMKKMVNGTMRGDSKVATPAAQITNTTSTPPTCCPPLPPPGSA